ncbi:hypothetical protein CTAYLR_010124 [Chrysophaeum taylorii]|uniref:GOST seven transmembrane domain-containing protein n=1 Tax=Chrysophaeum taylorii TaxID=2483200 RepID=A0AAD7UHX4_9STRA|nr:hypothetical protein CTAYLR_010124 [Chrysophaeum taylorii]
MAPCSCRECVRAIDVGRLVAVAAMSFRASAMKTVLQRDERSLRRLVLVACATALVDATTWVATSIVHDNYYYVLVAVLATETARRFSTLLVVLLVSLGFGVVRTALGTCAKATLVLLTLAFLACRVAVLLTRGDDVVGCHCGESTTVFFRLEAAVNIFFLIWSLCGFRGTVRAIRLSQALNDEVVDETVTDRYLSLRRNIFLLLLSASALYCGREWIVAWPARLDCLLGAGVLVKLFDLALLCCLCIFTHPLDCLRPRGSSDASSAGISLARIVNPRAYPRKLSDAEDSPAILALPRPLRDPSV